MRKNEEHPLPLDPYTHAYITKNKIICIQNDCNDKKVSLAVEYCHNDQVRYALSLVNTSCPRCSLFAIISITKVFDS